MGLVTPDLLRSLNVAGPDAWAGPLDEACAQHGITQPNRLAGFLGTFLVETGHGTALVESLNYTPEGLMLTWPARFTPDEAQAMGRTIAHPADQKRIAERVYGGRMGNGPEGCGDGWAYRGHGGIMLTGLDNFRREAEASGVPLPELPAWLTTMPGACHSAARFWSGRGCNELCDGAQFARARVLVNGGAVGLSEALGITHLALVLLTPTPRVLAQPLESTR